MHFVILFLVVAGCMVLFIIGVTIYNNLVSMRNSVENAWSQIDVLLKKRYDLVGNLVEATKGYAIHERETLEKVISARAQAIGAKTIDSKITTDGILTSALKSLFAVVENYPNLKANENFILLHNELVDIENQIAFARQNYNNTVYNYNVTLERFPECIVARILRFKKERGYIVAGDERKEEREPVKVKF